MLVYNYHPITAEYLGPNEADESPLEPGVFLIPADATTTEPPAQQEGFVRRFTNGAWGYSPIEEPDAEPTPEPEPYVPETISDRQFFQALAIRELITKAEALAAVSTGTLPAAMEAMLAGMSDDEEFAARMLLQGATTFKRSHPLTQAFGSGFGMTPEQIDELWIEADAL